MALNTTVTSPTADSYATTAQADDYVMVKPDYNKWLELGADKKEQLLKQATRQIDLIENNILPRYYQAMDYRDKQALRYPFYGQLEEFAVSVASSTTNTFASPNLVNISYIPDDFWNGGVVIVREGAGRGKTYDVSDFEASTGTITIDGVFTPDIDQTSQVLLLEAMDEEIINACIEQAFFLATGRDKEVVDRIQKGILSRKIDDISETYGTSGVMTAKGVPISTEAMAFLDGYIRSITNIRT